MKKRSIPLFINLVLCVTIGVVQPAASQIIYVAPDGNDVSNTGTIESPFESIQKAQQMVSPGDTVYIRGGTYQVREDQISEVVSNLFASITYLDKSGTENNRIKYWAYPGETPVFDFSEVKPPNRRVVGIYVRGNYIHIKGLEMTGIQTTITEHTESYAIYSRGNHNIYEQLSLHDNVGTGIRHFRGGHNLFLNIDAYRNWDTVSQDGRGSNNDGIGVHPDSDGVGNVIKGCRVWFNSDDGIDIIRADAPVRIDSSWAFYNGFDTNFNSLGDGSGFKFGGYAYDGPDRLPEVIPTHTITFSIAARNKAHGFYANHHLAGNIWYNNSAFQNPNNFNMLNRPSREDTEDINIDGYDHILINNLSYQRGFAFRHVINLDFNNSTLETNSWQLSGSLSDSDFESLDIDLLASPRKADGSLPDVDFMRPKEGSRIIDAGTDIGFNYLSTAPDLGAIETNHSISVQNQEEGDVPEEAYLKQNYPNPFNPTTKIIYEVPNSGQVKIMIYDRAGREVRTLLNEVKSTGTYELLFDGSNLASGIYYYSLQVEGSSVTKKMVLVK